MDNIIEVEQKTEAVVLRKYPMLVRTVKHHLPFISKDEMLTVISLITGICHRCWCHEIDCGCLNDEP